MSYKTIKERFIKESGDEVPLEAIDKLLDFHKKLKSLNRLDDNDIDIDSIACQKIFGELESYLYSKYDEDDALTNPEIKSKMYVLGENSEYIAYNVTKYSEINLFRGKTTWCICSGTKDSAKRTFYNYLNNSKSIIVYERKCTGLPKFNYIARTLKSNNYYDSHDNNVDEEYIRSQNINLPSLNIKIDEMFPKTFKKNSDGTYDILESILLREFENFIIQDNKLTVKFKNCFGDFYCEYVKLDSFSGFPQTIFGDLKITGCTIKRMTGFPKMIDSGDKTNLKITNTHGGLKSLKFLNKVTIKNPDVIFISNCRDLTKLNGLPNAIFDDKRKNKGVNLLLNSNAFEEISGINNIEYKISKLDLSYNCIRSIDGIPQHISHLIIFNNKLESLKGAGNISKISASCNLIKDFSGLDKDRKYKLLELSTNKITSLDGLPVNAEKISLEHNNIYSVENLSAEVLKKIGFDPCPIDIPSTFLTQERPFYGTKLFCNTFDRRINRDEDGNLYYFGELNIKKEHKYFLKEDGILTLPKFKFIEKLNCSELDINKIVNLPDYVGNLDISNNNFESIDDIIGHVLFKFNISDNPSLRISSIVRDGVFNCIIKNFRNHNTVYFKNASSITDNAEQTKGIIIPNIEKLKKNFKPSLPNNHIGKYYSQYMEYRPERIIDVISSYIEDMKD